MKLHHVLWPILMAGTLTLVQAQIDRATIEGVVSDPSGAAVPQAEIRIIRIATNDVIKLTTNEVGRYFAPNLPLGTYRVEVVGQPPMVDASTATATASMTTKYINEMPFIYIGRDRKIIDFMKFLPGLNLGDQNNPAANGAMRSSNEFF